MTLLRTGPSPRWALPLRCGLALSGWLAVAASGLPAGSVLRALVVTLFLLVCPGLAASRWARPPAGRETGRTPMLETAVLSLVVSLALAVVVVVPFYLGGVFTTLRALATLAFVTSALALLPVPRGPGRARASRRNPAHDPSVPSADPSRPAPPEGAPSDPGPSSDSRATGRPAHPGDRR
ncbi:hypothetical protein [Streptomyces griseorubiginosus]|uniref:hypothetical protein n=1 Tax=Streptomyces griseorubiginosus TaxID=67304 RepID=UPI001AD71FA3|nr:hypothetical protein [Streptomyces griseorubiginosus]MBO4253473.1 hypothetical protein [Streptomyces griseorubiginosus]